MARMMKAQMDHALSRLREAYEDILGRPPETDGHVKIKRKAQMIKKGEVEITQTLISRAITRFNRNLKTRWPDSIEECIQKELQLVLEDKYTAPPEDPALTKYNARRKKLAAKYQEAKDEIILGDVDRALKLIAEFRKTKV